MCGIIGAHGLKHASLVVRRGLERLEYRGYDSAGIAWLRPEGIEVLKAVGRVKDIEHHEPNGETVALGHTRWATHGGVTLENAHPHLDGTGRYCVVHNGTIEGHHAHRSRLQADGHAFRGQTDTEVIAHLYERARRDEEPVPALRSTLAHLDGSWALGILDSETNSLLFARNRTPLILGLRDQGTLIASDVTAILDQTRKVVYLDDGDHGIITSKGVELFGSDGKPKTLKVQVVDWDIRQAEKSGYDHFMLKEIHEAPTALNACLAGRIRRDPLRFDVGLEPSFLKNVKRIRLVGAGTSYHAALMGRHFLEHWAKIPCEAIVSSELRERPLLNEDGILHLAISQSGETLDTMEALRHVSSEGHPLLAITNVQGSSLQRMADHTILTRVGPEVGVAATKTLLGQVTTLAVLALQLAQQRQTMDPARLDKLAQEIQRLPRLVEETMDMDEQLGQLGRVLAKSQDLFFLGRGIHMATAMEAALKFKEITYRHAEGFGAAELKHGPFALLSDQTPCVFFVPNGPGRAKVIGNMVEVASRGAPVYAVANGSSLDLQGIADHTVVVPGIDPDISAVTFALAGQVVSYYAASALGLAIDMPRNLAKSVTVE